jgi:hypothetical protein
MHHVVFWLDRNLLKLRYFNILLIVGHQATLKRSILPERSNLFQSHWSNQWHTKFSWSKPSSRHRRYFLFPGNVRFQDRGKAGVCDLSCPH